MDPTLVALDVDTCVRLLEEHAVGRLALSDPEGPLVFPVNYVWHAGQVLFRSDLGTKLSAAESGAHASFQVDHVAVRERVGWSVLVRGRLREAADPAELDQLDDIVPLPFTRGAGKQHVVRLFPAEITGRRIPLPRDVPAGFYREVVLDSRAIDDDEEEES